MKILFLILWLLPLSACVKVISKNELASIEKHKNKLQEQVQSEKNRVYVLQKKLDSVNLMVKKQIDTIKAQSDKNNYLWNLHEIMPDKVFHTAIDAT